MGEGSIQDNKVKACEFKGQQTMVHGQMWPIQPMR